MRLLSCATLLLAAGTAVAQSVQYDGTAYDLESGEVIYRESHFFKQDGASAHRVVLYRCPSGTPFARKHVNYAAEPSSPDFVLEDARLGYREGVRAGAEAREVFVQRTPKDAEDAEPLPPGDDPATAVVIDAGFDDFVRGHWDQLQTGEDVHFPFLVPSRHDWWGFKIRKDRDEDLYGGKASVIQMSLGSWFGFLLPNVEVTYSNDQHLLLRFAGLSNVRDGKGKNYKARIEFPPESRVSLDEVAMQAAEGEALVSRCEG
jgi:hypothetical protein